MPVPSEMTDRDILSLADSLCRRLAKVDGWEFTGNVPIWRRLDNPRIARYWALAGAAFDELHGTELDQALQNTLSDEEEAAEEAVSLDSAAL